MTGAATIATEQGVLGHTLGFAPMPPATQVWVALCMASPPPSETQAGIEVSGRGYARVAATFALMADPSNAAANSGPVSFPGAQSDWGQVGWFEVWDAQRGGRRLYWGNLLDPVTNASLLLTVYSGDVVRFSPAALMIRIATADMIVGGPYLATSGGTMTGTLTMNAPLLFATDITTVASLLSLFTAALNSLPTAPQATPGWWNNGGQFAYS